MRRVARVGRAGAVLRSSVRLKLLAMALLPMLVVLPILLAFVLYWGNAYFDRLLILKVNSDLVVAEQYFFRVLERVGHSVGGVAAAADFFDVREAGDPARLSAFLAGQGRRLKLDFVQFVGLDGRVVASSLPGQAGGDRRPWPVVQRALQGNETTRVDVFDAPTLTRLAPRLAERARIDFVPTPNAAPTERSLEDRGLVIHAAVPVHDAYGRLVGVLEAGSLLNQNLDFVDTINDLVYREGSLPAGAVGTATVFIDDVRVATNVRLFGDRRALGTRVSQAVRDRVMGRGALWLGRAFVVNDWYVSAYEPLEDSFGKRVGMLYVGYLERPFAEVKRTVVATLFALFAAVAVLATPLFLRWARAVFRPVERMYETIGAVEAGDVAARTGEVGTGDELGRLAGHLDRMLDTVHRQNAELKGWADELDRKVAERTRELAEANERLRETQRQLVMSEKLAAIGQITAGVAHEINNPVAVIQGNLDLARELLGPAADVVRDELRLVDQQIQRINEIVTKLLQFARPTEFAGYVEAVDPAQALDDCLVLVRHLVRSRDIAVERDDRATRCAAINRNELQQVLVNLMVNAIHAMPGGGTLRLSSRDRDAPGEPPGVEIAVGDTGVGIRKEDLPRVFDAFFSTKGEGGTGLGLSISATLIARYGGALTVESEAGRGSTFRVCLPS